MQKSRILACLAFILLLSGCEVKLYTGLTEREGNDMLAILLEGGINARKELDKDKNLTLFVGQDQVSRAIRMLRNEGFPKDRFSSVSDIFPKDGLISSPTEERARYTYAMSQELAATLSMIDGVLTARVHVVLPQDSAGMTEDAFPSSASVFIKYTPELELGGFVPKVKTLVANSIEGLSLDKITVSLFPSARIEGKPTEVVSPELSTFLSIRVSPESKSRLYLLLGSLLILLVGVSAFCGWIIWQKMQRKRQGGDEEGDDFMAPVELDREP
ncbi:MAG: EscJ/YscJ/HrcJ family type III secretion inner membrane ring protein [Oceanospirillales bacterium LUC14_002_19_P2]|nr:MAG: EscJ/YscJ/HrcJ family type III secretion inner membrane ring protein [Oceanospirillales bacterium LUC14_002_19_P2]